jgi:hypothetical protein
MEQRHINGYRRTPETNTGKKAKLANSQDVRRARGLLETSRQRERSTNQYNNPHEPT